MLEIAVTSFEDAIHAQEGGADSIEISINLVVGGLTPPLDLVRRVRDAVSLDVHVIVRPHARDFVYTPVEIEQILHDTRALAKIGIDSVVFGAQSPDGRLNIDLIKEVKQAADSVSITVHRAIDESVEPEAALEALKPVVTRILTSGPAPNTWDGRDGLRRWVADFGDDFSFVASGGLKADFLSDYITYVRAQEYHFGGAARTDEKVDSAKVQQLREIIDQAK
jgi:copper homeostasis protein